MNRIYVTLMPDVGQRPDPNTGITISGLNAATAAEGEGVKETPEGRVLQLQTNDACGGSIFFSHKGCSDGEAGTASWNKALGTLTFFPHNSIWEETDDGGYPDIKVICFEIRNPDQEMPSPAIHIQTGGSIVNPKEPMWKDTFLKGIKTPSDLAAKKCYPAAVGNTVQMTATTYLTKADGITPLGTGMLGTADDIPSHVQPVDPLSVVMAKTKLRIGSIKVTDQTKITKCVPDAFGKVTVTADGVKNVILSGLGSDPLLEETPSGCGCEVESGELVAGEGPDGDGKFLAMFTSKFYCSGTGRAYDTRHGCAKECNDPYAGTGAQPGDLWSCSGRIASIDILNPGHGYTTPPPIKFKDPSAVGCQGVNFTAVLNSGRGFSAQVPVVYVCDPEGAPTYYRELARCSKDCSMPETCTGVPYFSDTDTYSEDKKIIPKVDYTNVGAGYEKEDTLSIKEAGCQWEGKLADLLKLGDAVTNINSVWAHVSEITGMHSGTDCHFSPRKNMWHYFHTTPELGLKWTDLDTDKQAECATILTPELAPAPYLSKAGFNADMEDGGWSTPGDSAPLKVGGPAATSDVAAYCPAALMFAACFSFHPQCWPPRGPCRTPHPYC